MDIPVLDHLNPQWWWFPVSLLVLMSTVHLLDETDQMADHARARRAARDIVATSMLWWCTLVVLVAHSWS